MTPAASASTVELSSRTGRAVVLAAVLGSGLAMLDGSVVNVALRTIGTDLDASLAELQWINNAYLLTLASFILLGGSLGDRFGRRRIFVVGTIWFALRLPPVRHRAHPGGAWSVPGCSRASARRCSRRAAWR